MGLLDGLALDEGGGETLVGDGLHRHEIDLGQRRQAEGRRLDQPRQQQEHPGRDDLHPPALAHGPERGHQRGALQGHGGAFGDRPQPER